MDLNARPARPGLLRWVPLLVTVVLATLAFVTLPRQPYVIDDTLSERAVLSFAHEHGLQFGTDIVYTYGPLGFLTSRHYFPHAASVRMAVDILLGLVVSLGVCFGAWRLRLGWRVLFVGVFVYMAANIDPRTDLLIYIGLLCWGLLCLTTSKWRLALCSACFILLAAFGMLVKANFLFVAGLAAGAIMAELLSKGHWRASSAIGFGLVVAFTLGWCLAGQSLLHLPTYFANAISIIQGYDQAVGLDGIETFKWRGLLLFTIALLAAMPRALSSDDSTDSPPAGLACRRAVRLVWLVLFLFLVWKHGFVRADVYHMGFFFGFVPVFVWALEILPCGRIGARLWGRGLALAACLVALGTLQSLFFTSLKASLIQPFAGVQENLTALLGPGDYRRQMQKAYEAARQAAQLPKLGEVIGDSTVDIFGQDQCQVLFNNWRYHPRPVFQSYLTYNQRLMTLNELFFLSRSAPQYVVFNLNGSDHKYPPLEDAGVLRALLINYQPVAEEGPFVLLKQNSRHSPKLTLLREGTVPINSLIDVTAQGDDLLWMEIRIEPSWRGRLRQIFYKPAKVRIVLRSESNALLARSSAPTPMLAAGFLVSPVLLHTEDVLNVYAGKTAVRPATCGVNLGSEGGRFWRPEINFRLFKVEGPGQPASAMAP